MILAFWLNGLKSTHACRRFGRLANRVRPTAKRRKLIDAGWFHKPIHTAEILEDRTLLFAPVALDDSYSVAEDTQLVVSASGILSNDYDNDFDPITASLVADVSHGTLSLSSDGSFTYDPDTSYNGLDTFTYVANDGSENSNTATVTITVGTNTAPDAVNDSYTVKKGYLNTDTESLDGVIENDTDAESHPLTATLQSGPSNGTILDWTAGKKFGPNSPLKVLVFQRAVKVGHTIKGPRGIVSRRTKGFNNARDVIARDIKELRRVYPNIPNSKLRELIEMNKSLYRQVNK